MTRKRFTFKHMCCWREIHSFWSIQRNYRYGSWEMWQRVLSTSIALHVINVHCIYKNNTESFASALQSYWVISAHLEIIDTTYKQKFISHYEAFQTNAALLHKYQQRMPSNDLKYLWKNSAIEFSLNWKSIWYQSFDTQHNNQHIFRLKGKIRDYRFHMTFTSSKKREKQKTGRHLHHR